MKTEKILNRFSIVLLASLVIAPFTTSFTPGVAFASGACTTENTTLNTVAHEDDSLLFQSPDLLHAIQSGHCTRTVFTTAGDAGLPSTYWLSREDGAKAAYANMAGVANIWTTSDAGVPGHPMPLFTLVGNPNVSLVFMRLPDGGVDGGGLSNPVSLQKLWEGSVSSLTTIDGSSSYSKQDLIAALASIMTSYQPAVINTQNYLGTFDLADHSDHIATAYFTKSAHNLYTTPHTLYAYKGYDSVFSIANVFGTDAVSKNAAFFAYTPFDADACGQTYAECAGSYDNWLDRQYTAGSETGGVVDVCPNLDGTQTTVPSGYDKVGNQCVAKSTICQSIVSDTSDMTSGTAHAVATFVSPEWTAGANIPGATWIWNAFHVADPANGETVTFTKQITATGTVTAASIVIASDDNYEASLNGTPFASSSILNNFSAGNEDTYNLLPLLQNGTNTLTITVHNFATGDTDPELNPAGLRYKLDISKSSCTDTGVTPPPTDTGGSTGGTSGGTSGGGGGGSSLPKLKISDQKTAVVRSSGNVVVSWVTSRPAYGHVIYGLDTGSPYTLDLTKPNFGYPSSFPTDPSVVGHLDPQGKTILHVFTLKGLTPGKKYRYRIVSHASPAVASEEGFFTVPLFGMADMNELAISDESGGSNNAVSQQSSGGASAPATASEEQSPTDNVENVEDANTNAITTDVNATDTATNTVSEETPTNNTATALASFGGSKVWQIGLPLLVVLIAGVWYFFGRRKNSN